MSRFIEVNNVIFNTDKIIYIDEPYEEDRHTVNNKWKISIHYECEVKMSPKFSWWFNGDAGKKKAWEIYNELKRKLVPESDPINLTAKYKEKI